ncbi:MAG: iron ABC transporter permease, partial [Victivallales bacterium]|nr:iron ABC transporter permease [Victivallales bacterium]
MSRRVFTYLALALICLLFGAFFFFPILQVLRGGFTNQKGQFTLVYLLEVFRNRLYLEGLWNSFRLAVCTTSLSLLIAVPLAWLADRFDFRGKRWLSGALLLPMILPPFVGALGMQAIFGQMGAANILLGRLGLAGGINWLGGGFWGVVAMEALHLYPILYLNSVAALANVDPQLLEASADCGCVGFRRLRRVVLPLIMPGIFAGSTIVFIWSFTELGTPLMFHYGRVTAVQVFDGIKEVEGNAMPYALVTVMMVVAASLYLLARMTFGRQAYAMTSKAGVASSARRLRGWA